MKLKYTTVRGERRTYVFASKITQDKKHKVG